VQPTSHNGKRKPKRAAIVGAACVAVLVAAATFYWYRAEEAEPARGPRGGGRAAAPVSVAVASRQDVPIYVTGIGSVQA
jgi:multidrug efflux pump subunit AcrA (membrane-fusion protein)